MRGHIDRAAVTGGFWLEGCFFDQAFCAGFRDAGTRPDARHLCPLRWASQLPQPGSSRPGTTSRRGPVLVVRRGSARASLSPWLLPWSVREAGEVVRRGTPIAVALLVGSALTGCPGSPGSWPCGRAPGVAIAGWRGGEVAPVWRAQGRWKSITKRQQIGVRGAAGRRVKRSCNEMVRQRRHRGAPEVPRGSESPGLPNRALTVRWTPTSCVQGASDRQYVKKANRK